MEHDIEAYDVLQVYNGLQWVDFCTLRTKDDIALAFGIVKTGSFAGKPGEYRIVKQFPFTVKISK